jgi:hypothetical protein
MCLSDDPELLLEHVDNALAAQIWLMPMLRCSSLSLLLLLLLLLQICHSFCQASCGSQCSS